MEKFHVLLNKSIQTIHEEGLETFLCKTKRYLKARRKKQEEIEVIEEPLKYYMDVLFINGCYLPHPSRYRVSHQREQLLAASITSSEVFYTKLSEEMISHFRIFIFYRCPYTEIVGNFIKKAKELNKTVLFDIDDLVIDKKYTNTILYLNNMNKEERKVYDDGVDLIQKTLRLCDGAITTTEALAKELKNYVPKVYINRNTASDRMCQLSEWANYDRDVLPYKSMDHIKDKREKENYQKAYKWKLERERRGVRLGYFSGSITHNDDFQMILPLIYKMMKRYPNLELSIVGELELPESLKKYRNRIIVNPFLDWTKLPRLIASVDINLAPLQNGIFNEAKSENKWVEAALVKVPTIASKIGAFEKMIIHRETGLLCENEKEWEEALIELIENKEYRGKIAEQAYQYVKKHCTTINTAYPFSEFIKKEMKPNIVFVLPTIQISGGVLVVMKHCEILRKIGYDVCIFNNGFEKEIYLDEEKKLPVLCQQRVGILGSIEKAVATLWTTVEFLQLYPNIKERYYLVQGHETDFYQEGEYFRFKANQTYYPCVKINFITISKWCQNWLLQRYGKDAKYAPNGLDLRRFSARKRQLSNKIRILIEGNNNDYYKNVDESFKIIEKLDRKKFEIWYMSYQGKPKEWYQVDRFLHKIPNKKVAKVYQQCDILLKTSILESFSYPPLEMMATGGYVVAVANEGNMEYLKDKYNCLFYHQGNIEDAVRAIKRLCVDKNLQNVLYENGIKTAKERDWSQIKNEIAALYK